MQLHYENQEKQQDQRGGRRADGVGTVGGHEPAILPCYRLRGLNSRTRSVPMSRPSQPAPVRAPAPKLATRAGIQMRDACPAAKAPVIRPAASVCPGPSSRGTQSAPSMACLARTKTPPSPNRWKCISSCVNGLKASSTEALTVRCPKEFAARLAKPSAPRPHSAGELIASLKSAAMAVLTMGVFRISLSRKSLRRSTSWAQADPSIRDTAHAATKSLRIKCYGNRGTPSTVVMEPTAGGGGETGKEAGPGGPARTGAHLYGSNSKIPAAPCPPPTHRSEERPLG